MSFMFGSPALRHSSISKTGGKQMGSYSMQESYAPSDEEIDLL